jgi:hypothetical protein
VKASATNAFVFWYGAIAQLGERVLCKHEVVGSIPSGSTSLRWLRQQRLGKPIVAKAVASKLEERRRADLIGKTNRPRKHHFACVVLTDAPAGFLTS